MNKFKKGDTVKVITGKDSGKEGQILAVNPDKQTVIVENINIVKRHTKATNDSKGGIVEKPSPISWSNVMLIAPGAKEPTRVKFSYSKDKKVREAKKNGKVFS